MERLYEIGFCGARKVPARRSNIFKHFAGQVAWTAPGRIGFMSTQRQDGRLRPASSMSCARQLEQALSAPFARSYHVQAAKYSGGGTAPPYRNRLATNSLQSDRLTTQLDWFVLSNICNGGCPPGPATARQPSGQRFSGHPFRSSPPLQELRASMRPCRVYPQL